jgi:alkylated DNA repair dioxygenase AlkB
MSGPDMFSSAEPIVLNTVDGIVYCWLDVLPLSQADNLLNQLLEQSAWQQESIHLYDKSLPQPRLTCWYGKHAASAASGYNHLSPAHPYTTALLALKDIVEQLTEYNYNSTLANLYRDGQDSVGYHADDEAVLGPQPVIASFSLGATRRFLLKHNNKQHRTISCDLPHNSLLLMAGPLQQHWQHAIGKTTKVVGPRVNLTFRHLNKM